MSSDEIIVLVFVGLPILAVLPTVIGLVRDVESKGLLIFFNVLGVVTVAGWVGAMILACGMPKRDRRPPLYVIPPVGEQPWPDEEPPDGARHWQAAS